jgi:hypothetical protein
LRFLWAKIMDAAKDIHKEMLPMLDRGNDWLVYRALRPVHTSVISLVELAALTHVTVTHSFTCLRKTGRAYHSTARKVNSIRICETVPLRSRRDLRWPRERTSSQTRTEKSVRRVSAAARLLGLWVRWDNEKLHSL